MPSPLTPPKTATTLLPKPLRRRLHHRLKGECDGRGETTFEVDGGDRSGGREGGGGCWEEQGEGGDTAGLSIGSKSRSEGKQGKGWCNINGVGPISFTLNFTP